MEVTVRLHATLRRPTPEGYQNRLTVQLEKGATIASLLNALELEIAPEHLMVVVNRRQVEPDFNLNEHDEVFLFPPISGGLK